jgi:GTPase involved in cell partitioning and DNA repair
MKYFVERHPLTGNITLLSLVQTAQPDVVKYYLTTIFPAFLAPHDDQELELETR